MRGMSASFAAIRTQIFGVTQKAMGDIAGLSQATISRIESGELAPDAVAMSRIRDAARARRPEVAWNDAWFFDEPIPPTVQAPSHAEAAS